MLYLCVGDAVAACAMEEDFAFDKWGYVRYFMNYMIAITSNESCVLLYSIVT